MTSENNKLPIEKILFYTGEAILFAALFWILINIVQIFGQIGAVVLGVLYFIGFFIAAKKCRNKTFDIQASILYTIALSMVPLSLLSLLNVAGILDYDTLGRICSIVVEVLTIALGAFLIHKTKYSLLTLPVCIAGLYLMCDIMPFITGVSEISWDMRKIATFSYSIILLFLASRFDKFKLENLAKWLYIYGATLLWGVLVLAFSTSFRWAELGEFGEFLLAFFAFEYIVINSILKRKIFLFWGIVGIFCYVAHLGLLLFAGTPFLPLLFGVFGLLIMQFSKINPEQFKKLESRFLKLIKFE